MMINIVSGSPVTFFTGAKKYFIEDGEEVIQVTVSNRDGKVTWSDDWPVLVEWALNDEIENVQFFDYGPETYRHRAVVITALEVREKII